MVINDLAGLMEALLHEPEFQADIYRLASDLQLNSDQLLSLVEAAELLGFATVKEGDIVLTPLGETFAEASILARKEIFATRIRRLPIFKWIMALLRAADQQRLGWDVILAALGLEFPPQEAERQLDLIVDWGRYAELLVYDDDTAILQLEAPQPA